MTKLGTLVIISVLGLGLEGQGRAETQAGLATKADREGQRLMSARKFREASSRFREAVARVPEGKYFYHLCTSLFEEGKHDDAITACTAAENTNPEKSLAGQIRKALEAARAAKRGGPR